MARGDHLGEFEQIVLLAVLQAGDDAYGMRVRQEIEARTGRDVSIGAVYATLDRLEGKGLVSSSLGDPTPERGGRARKFFRVEPAGTEALRVSREMLARMWKGVSLEWPGRA